MTGSASVILLGSVAERPEVLQTKTGKAWTKLVLEIKTYRRVSDGDPQAETTLVPIQLFSRIAEVARDSLAVGDAVAIKARISGTEYADKQSGKTRRGVTLTADLLHLLPNGRGPSSTREAKAVPGAAQTSW